MVHVIHAARSGVQVVVSFDDFFRAQQRPLLRLCYLATLDVEAAADVAQEALSRAWQHWDKIEGTRPDAWLRTVALNLCRSRWRKLGREARLRRTGVEVVEAVVRDVDLLAALRSLPQRQREAVVLHHLEDLRIEDCAAAMGLSAGSVKQHLSRGRAALAVALATPMETQS
jgi:RNA polymerase sigma-70 factor (ECF subfamily)